MKPAKDPEKAHWKYWSAAFGNLKTALARTPNPARAEPNEMVISGEVDTRECVLCGRVGEKSEAGRLLFYETKKWVHVNCIIWNTTIQESKVLNV